MKTLRYLILAGIVSVLVSCQEPKTPIFILADGQSYFLTTNIRIPARIISSAGLSLNSQDCVLYRGLPIAINSSLPDATSYNLIIRRSVKLTVNSPGGNRELITCAQTVGQAMAENGYTLYIADRIDPPADTPLERSLSISYQPSRSLSVLVDGMNISIRSSATTVGQALAEAGIPLMGLDSSIPPEYVQLPADGEIRIVRVTEAVNLTRRSIPFASRTEPSADLELDQQALIQGGEPGLSIIRERSRFQNGKEISKKIENENLVRPPQDRILGFGTKIVIRSDVVDGNTIEYYRALNMMTTSYSPCRSATPDGRCSYGTSSGLPVQRGTVAMVYSWYLAFGSDRLYIPGYGFAAVGDVGGGYPPGNHFWLDLAWTDADYQPMTGWKTVYFLTPVPKNLVYVLP
jgi:resuscitation-promoting factor RpfB